MAKQKLRWEYPPQIYTLFVLPGEFTRVHQPVTHPMQLRNCQHGYNDEGKLIKILYSSPDQQFFTKEKDGWHEQLPCDNHRRRKEAGRLVGHKSKGGGYDCPFMANFGYLSCHRAVAYAWCEWPKEAKTDPMWYKKFEVDHKNCDHSNFSPENLEWVKHEENNRRRRKVEEPLKKLGITKISWVKIPHLECLYQFTDVQLEYFFERLPYTMQSLGCELSIENINDAIHLTINDTLLKL